MRSGKGPVSCAPLGDGRGSFLLQWRGKAGIMSIRKPAFRAVVRSIVPDGAEKRKRKGDAATEINFTGDSPAEVTVQVVPFGER